MPQRQLMNEQQLGEWILRSLGAPFVEIELTACHLQDCIDDAKQWFTSKKGARKTLMFDAIVGESEYTLPDDVEVVTDVAFSAPASSTVAGVLSAGFGPGFGGVDIMGGILVVSGGGISMPAFTSTVTGGPLSSYVQSVQYAEQMTRVFSSDLDWRADGRLLRLFPPQSFPNGKVWVEYKTNTFSIEQLPERDHMYVKDYSLMAAKKRVGQVRSKYTDGFPGASGPTQLNGADLLEQARAEEEKLEESILRSGYPMGFILG